MSKRFFDLLLVFLLTPLLLIPFTIVAICIGITSPGPVLYCSQRVGKDNILFLMLKFRTMRIDTPEMATNLLKNPLEFMTPIGSFLRKTSLDELPQLWSIFVGDMTFVGPRPALFNQDDLISLRTQYGVDKLVPGLTGWAQVNGRDELSIPIKVQYDVEYLRKQSFWFDLKILSLTLLKVVRRSGVSH